MERVQKGVQTLFLYVGIAISLLVTVVASFFAAFDIIEHFILPESFGWYDFYYSISGGGGLSTSVAFLIVGFVVLCILSRTVRSITSHQSSDTVWYKGCQSVIMIVLALSLGAVFITSALVLDGILDGDISLAYALQLLFTFGVGLMVFYYYRGVLRGVWRTHRKEEKTFLFSVVILVILLITSGVYIMNPLDRRDLDDTYATLHILETTHHEVNKFYKEKKYLPADLDTIPHLADSDVRWSPFNDGMAEEVVYEKTAFSTYSLCTSFRFLPEGIDFHDYPFKDFPVEKVGDVCFDFDARTSTGK